VPTATGEPEEFDIYEVDPSELDPH